MNNKNKPRDPNDCQRHFITTNYYNPLTNKAECFFCKAHVLVEQTNERGQVLLKKHKKERSK